ncbi:MAG: ABC transporter ATP-binding protein, partial [Alphaproteobacteria bacterium]|nr:ABC transporter ATP-binding protein [Alphaproteobacteria bacterium]
TALFRGLTVLENVLLAVGERRGTTNNMIRAAGSRRDVVEEAYGLLEHLGIADDAARLVRELPYGRQRLTEIAMALALKPRVLLLDEPAAGVPSTESAVILDVVGALPAEIAVLIIEHDMDLVFRFAQRITVLVEGGILTEGRPAEIAADARVREVYLGSSRSAKANHG